MALVAKVEVNKDERPLWKREFYSEGLTISKDSRFRVILNQGSVKVGDDPMCVRATFLWGTKEVVIGYVEVFAAMIGFLKEGNVGFVGLEGRPKVRKFRVYVVYIKRRNNKTRELLLLPGLGFVRVSWIEGSAEGITSNFV